MPTLQKINIAIMKAMPLLLSGDIGGEVTAAKGTLDKQRKKQTASHLSSWTKLRPFVGLFMMATIRRPFQRLYGDRMADSWTAETAKS
jgi:hypothetical protein